jgi:chromatin segregation and condensation protein Rec8/ScpA/Scc1 (kleisin family)
MEQNIANNDEKQKTLLEFFELVEKPMWQTVLRAMIQKYGMQIWDIDVSVLLEKLLADAYEKENLKNASLIVLICTILLKSKSRRIGLRELEQNIKDDLKEIEQIQEMDELEIISDPEAAQKYNDLLELESKLKRLFDRQERNLNPKTIKEFQYTIRIESYFQLKSKLIGFFANNDETTYSNLRSKVETNNSLIMGLLLLNNENKVSLKQKVPYEDFVIKKIVEKN